MASMHSPPALPICGAAGLPGDRADGVGALVARLASSRGGHPAFLILESPAERALAVVRARPRCTTRSSMR